MQICASPRTNVAKEELRAANRAVSALSQVRCQENDWWESAVAVVGDRLYNNE